MLPAQSWQCLVVLGAFENGNTPVGMSILCIYTTTSVNSTSPPHHHPRSPGHRRGFRLPHAQHAPVLRFLRFGRPTLPAAAVEAVLAGRERAGRGIRVGSHSSGVSPQHWHHCL